MSTVSQGRPSMSSKAWAGELRKLLQLIGALEWERGAQPLVDSAQLGKARGIYSGIPCTAVWVNNPMARDQELANSVSLILDFSQPTGLSFQLRNAAGVQRVLYLAQENAGEPTEVDPRLLTAEEVSDLQSMGVPFILNLLEDRVTITIYGMYPVECYGSFLEMVSLIHERVAALGC
jgi:hypothetical protein